MNAQNQTEPSPGASPGSGDAQIPPTQVVYVSSPPTNGFAIAGFICSFFFQVLGLIFCAVALGQINRAGDAQGGKGLAIAGLVISIVSLAIGLLYLIVWLVLFGTLASALAGLGFSS